MERNMIPIAIIIIAIGCQTDSDRVAELASRHATEQSELSRQTVELQTELVEGTRQLVEADSQSRRDFLELEGKLDEQRAEIGHRHDELESERRLIAKQRYRDPIIANAVTAIGALLACLLPLLLAGYLLKCQLGDQEEYAITEVLLEEIASGHSAFVRSKVPTLALNPDDSTPKLPGDPPRSPHDNLGE